VHRFVRAPAKLWGCCRCFLGRDLAQLFVLGPLVGAALTSCAVGPDYHPPEPPIPSSFAAASLQTLNDHYADRPLATTQWWRTLHDRDLDSLVARAIAGSPTLEIALDRLQQARAQEVVVVGAALPVAGFTAGGGWGTGNDLARGRASPTLVSAETLPSAGNQVANLVGFGKSTCSASSGARSRRRNTMLTPPPRRVTSC
jgi:outer membrane protein TolC